MSSEEESVGDVDENDLEIFERGDDVEEPQNLAEDIEVDTAEPNTDNQDAEDKKVVKPKRVIKNPQPKLNEQTLKEPRGLPALLGHFENVKFKGRHYEQHDLNKLMSTYQYWCHRLIPKFTFDDCIARLEVLGSKKATQTQLKRIRMGIEFDNDDNRLINEDEDQTADSVDTPQDQFDQLLPSNSQSVLASAPQLTDEQMERIRQNKERAQRLRMERLRNIQEKAQNSLQPSQSLMPRNEQPSITGVITADKQVLGSDSENEAVEETVRKSIKRCIIESDEDVGFDDGNINSKIDSDKELGNIAEKVQNNSLPSESLVSQPSTSRMDTIDNILDVINADKPSSVKHKKHVLESGSEDEAVEETTVRKSTRRCIIDSDEESDNVNINSKSSNSRQIIDSDEEDENMGEDNFQEKSQNIKDVEVMQKENFHQSNKNAKTYFEGNGYKEASEEDEDMDMDSILTEINR